MHLPEEPGVVTYKVITSNLLTYTHYLEMVVNDRPSHVYFREGGKKLVISPLDRFLEL